MINKTTLMDALGAIPSLPEIKRDSKGDPIIETVELNLGDVKIRFLDSDGDPVRPGSTVQTHMFIIEGPGIDSRLVRSVELPKLDYAKADILTVKIEMYTSVRDTPECESK